MLQIAYSTDGLTWAKVTPTPVFAASTAIDCVAWDNGRFVAGGLSGSTAWSTDGVGGESVGKPLDERPF